jgi:hypothetical protein
MSRLTTHLFEMTGRVQENLRLEIFRAFLDIRGERLRHLVQACCADETFNLDEVGISEWKDRFARKVIVPVWMSGQTIHHGVHGNLKHISMGCCVSASGESMTFFMASRKLVIRLARNGKLSGVEWESI